MDIQIFEVRTLELTACEESDHMQRASRSDCATRLNGQNKTQLQFGESWVPPIERSASL